MRWETGRCGPLGLGNVDMKRGFRSDHKGRFYKQRAMRPVTNWGQEAICRPFLRILKKPKLPTFKVVMAIDRNKWWFPGSGWKQVLHV